jgi:hypothetical protein
VSSYLLNLELEELHYLERVKAWLLPPVKECSKYFQQGQFEPNLSSAKVWIWYLT